MIPDRDTCIRCDSEKTSKAQLTADDLWNRADLHDDATALTIMWEATERGTEINANIRKNVSKVLKIINDTKNGLVLEKKFCVDLTLAKMPSYVRIPAARAESIIGTLSAMYASASTVINFEVALQHLLDNHGWASVDVLDDCTGGSSEDSSRTPSPGDRRTSARIAGNASGTVLCDGKYRLGTSTKTINFTGN